jgi:predicted transcriptional regulator
VVSEPADSGCRAAVLKALQVGPSKRGDIIAATGFSVSAVQKELGALVAEVPALVRKTDKHGEYELTRAGRGES